MVSGAGNFLVTSFPCNPGMASMFPWLSSIGQSYETYKFRELCFKYSPACASTTAGTVGMAFDFDTNDVPPDTYLNALSYYDKSVNSAWAAHTLRPDLSQGDKLPSRYTRPGSLAGEDMKTFDVGRLHIFTSGITTASQLGQVEVCYTVDLFTPQPRKIVGGEFRSNSGLSPTQLFSNLVPDAKAIAMFVDDPTNVGGSLLFPQAWEGRINYELTGQDILGAGMNMAGTATTRQHAHAVNPLGEDLLQLIGGYDVKAAPGQVITPQIFGGGSFAGITAVLWTFASMAYPAQ